MSDHDYEFILYETDRRVATVTLNRPEKLNALSNELRGELFHGLKRAEADPSVGVVIVKGAGRAFSAGYDLQPSPSDSPYVSEFSRMPDTGTTHPQHYDWSRHAVMGNFVIWELAKPVIAQVHGYCLAGATELASACDLRIVADDCQVGYPPVRAMGTMDAMWAPWHLPQAKAREFAYVGDPHSGADMTRWGWANYSMPADELGEFTMEFAQRMANIDNHLLMYSKRAVNRAFEIMGYKTAMISGTDVEAMSKHRPEAGEWRERVARDGLKGALEWRDGPFRDFRGARSNAPHDRGLATGSNAESKPSWD